MTDMGVAKALVQGLVINSWVFRAMVNLPQANVTDKVAGTVAGGIRYMLGLSRLVPKWVVYGKEEWGGLGWPDPREVLAKSMVRERKAMNSNNKVVAEMLWCEYAKYAVKQEESGGKDVALMRQVLEKSYCQVERVEAEWWKDEWGVAYEEWEPVVFTCVDASINATVPVVDRCGWVVWWSI